jgi:hypothetical protein
MEDRLLSLFEKLKTVKGDMSDTDKDLDCSQSDCSERVCKHPEHFLIPEERMARMAKEGICKDTECAQRPCTRGHPIFGAKPVKYEVNDADLTTHIVMRAPVKLGHDVVETSAFMDGVDFVIRFGITQTRKLDNLEMRINEKIFTKLRRAEAEKYVDAQRDVLQRTLTEVVVSSSKPEGSASSSKEVGSSSSRSNDNTK